MTGPRFTPEEDAVIAEVYPTGGGKACAEILGRSRDSCAARAKRIGVRTATPRGRANPWSELQDRVVLALLLRACKLTGRTPLAVIRHQEWLIKKHREATRNVEKEQEEQEDG